ncbi:hypothetical protein PROSTU_03405 [Providencia stuartii ATCC 25827]|uniref:Uncharacterized protein n=1 Tax=Providencia stuartii ATCC 25827 TaxID=471874 RepID=A0AA86YX62_PROST|nr:hypothetical protein PROSTU_03405 [Providencia stuartii ATCC 25827]
MIKLMSRSGGSRGYFRENAINLAQCGLGYKMKKLKGFKE